MPAPERLGAVEHGVDVDIHCSRPQVDFSLQRRLGDADPGVVDEDVNRSDSRFDIGAKCVHDLRFGQVGLAGMDLVTLCREFAGRFGRAVRFDVDDDDVCSGFGKSPGFIAPMPRPAPVTTARRPSRRNLSMNIKTSCRRSAAYAKQPRYL
jgi:hypothetical protein